MNIALVDDVERDRRRLEYILKEYDRINRVDMRFYHYAGGEALLRDFQPFGFAVIFLDIFMDGMTGMELARRIREKDDAAVLVFLTTSGTHYSEAFDVFASAYLRKPCAEEEVFRAMDHILRLRTQKEKRFDFSFDRRDYSLRYADLVSLETSGNYLTIVDRGGNSYRTRMTFSAAESLLDTRFLTLMKGIMVNMDYIVQIADGKCFLRGGTVFPLHVKNQKELKQKWLNFKFAKIRGELDDLHDAREGSGATDQLVFRENPRC
ncbi:MAG: response regulator transcription factor [Clostridia bacterium]|nr:response regulator transcription factor [Clostridia bacterium]MBQ5544869.1 response regulator transcription factor [Clostridia bacterium]